MGMAERAIKGVVAALVRSRVTAVSAILDGVLSPDVTPAPVQAGPEPDLNGLLGTTPEPSSTSGGRSPRPTRTSPSPTRSPTTTPTTIAPTPVNDLVTTIGGLLSGSPSPLFPIGGGLLK